MKKIFYIEGKRWIADTDKDELLYRAPHNPPNTGDRYLEGSDLYAHKTKDHGYQFYTLNWSMWQSAEPFIRSKTRDEAIKFLESCVGDYNDFPDETDIEDLRKYGIELLLEEA